MYEGQYPDSKVLLKNKGKESIQGGHIDSKKPDTLELDNKKKLYKELQEHGSRKETILFVGVGQGQFSLR